MTALTENDAKYIDPIKYSRWKAAADQKTCLAKIGYISGQSKEAAARDFKTTLAGFSKQDTIIYTDESQARKRGETTTASAGWVGYQAEQQIFRGNEPLGSQVEAYDTEVQATSRGLEQTLSLPTARMADNIHVRLDNLAVAVQLGSRSTRSSQVDTEKCVYCDNILTVLAAR